jgi:hypothetical protein
MWGSSHSVYMAHFTQMLQRRGAEGRRYCSLHKLKKTGATTNYSANSNFLFFCLRYAATCFGCSSFQITNRTQGNTAWIEQSEPSLCFSMEQKLTVKCLHSTWSLKVSLLMLSALDFCTAASIRKMDVVKLPQYCFQVTAPDNKRVLCYSSECSRWWWLKFSRNIQAITHYTVIQHTRNTNTCLT